MSKPISLKSDISSKTMGDKVLKPEMVIDELLKSLGVQRTIENTSNCCAREVIIY